MIHGLRVANITLNRKVLADLAVTEPSVFAELAAKAQRPWPPRRWLASEGGPPRGSARRPRLCFAGRRFDHYCRTPQPCLNRPQAAEQKYRAKRGFFMAEGWDLLMRL